MHILHTNTHTETRGEREREVQTKGLSSPGVQRQWPCFTCNVCWCSPNKYTKKLLSATFPAAGHNILVFLTSPNFDAFFLVLFSLYYIICWNKLCRVQINRLTRPTLHVVYEFSIETYKYSSFSIQVSSYNAKNVYLQSNSNAHIEQKVLLCDRAKCGD